jgi:hypothetical protein
MKLKNFYPILLFFFSGIFLFSCKKFEDLDKISKTAWNPNLAIPIGYANFDVYDILAAVDSTDLIIIDAQSGAIALNYFDEIGYFDAQSIVNLGSMSQSFDFNIATLNIPIAVNYTGNNATFRTEVIPLGMQNGEEIRSIFFKDGQLNMHFETTLRHDLQVTIAFPDFIKNGVPVTASFTMNFAGTVPQTSDLNIDLSEVLADFTNNGTGINETRVTFDVVVMGNGQPVAGNETLSCDVTSSNLDFHNVKGYLGQQNIAQISDSVLLKIFKNSTEGTFELTNPTIKFTVANSFGIPIQLNLDQLKTINQSTGNVTNLLNYPTTLNVTAPAAIGQTSISSLTLDNSNTSNLSSIIAPTPKYFYYEVNGAINPAGQGAIENFVDENSVCSIKAEVNLPLEGYAYGFYIRDTIDFDNFKNENTEYIESVMFRLIVDNGFPVNLGTQITAVDENWNELFSIFNQAENILDAPQVDSNGKVIADLRKISDITLTQSQIKSLANARKLIVYAEASTTNADAQTVVKFYDSYKIGIKLALQIQGQTQF